MKIYHCEDSLEGIFTAIYNTYEDHCIIRDTMVTTIEENLLFSESVEVIPDPEKTIKVIRTLKRRFGESDYETLCLALASPKPEKAQAVYRTIAKGLTEKCEGAFREVSAGTSAGCHGRHVCKPDLQPGQRRRE